MIEQIQFEKRLKFFAKKCELLAIGFDHAGYTLDVNGRTIKHVCSVKYPGDILNYSRSITEVPKSTPTAVVYIEFGKIYITFFHCP